MAEFLQLAFNGLTIGSIYALIALGYTLVWRTARTVNLAHGDIFTAGAYAALALGGFSVARQVGWPPWAAIVGSLAAAGIIGALLGVGVDRGIFRPLRQAGELTPLLCSLGASSVLENVYFLVFSSRDRSVPVQLPTGGFDVGGAHVTYVQVTIFATAAALVVGLNLLVRRTRLGRAIRAVAADAPVARLMGIPADAVITWVFALASCLGAVGGMLEATYFGIASPFMGFCPASRDWLRPSSAASAASPAPLPAACCWASSRPWARATSPVTGATSSPTRCSSL